MWIPPALTGIRSRYVLGLGTAPGVAAVGWMIAAFNSISTAVGVGMSTCVYIPRQATIFREIYLDQPNPSELGKMF